MNGTPAELAGRREGLVLRVARLSDLRDLSCAARQRAPLYQALHPLIAGARQGKFALRIEIAGLECAAIDVQSRPSAIAAWWLRMPVAIRWGALIKVLFSRSPD